MNVFECSTIDIAPTISRLLRIPMVTPSGRQIPQVEKYAKERGCKKAGIIVVDSLGYCLCKHLSPVMRNLTEFAREGLMFKCKSMATITSPAIASIFTGYLPEEHNIYSTADIYAETAKDSENPRLKTIMEWAYRAGMRASIVIELKSAECFGGRLSNFYGVQDSKDILAYDRQITEYAVQSLKEGTEVIAVHLRSIDHFCHKTTDWKEVEKAAKCMDRNLAEIFQSSEKGTIYFICGDHTIHGWRKWSKHATKEEIKNHKKNLVALVVGCI